MSFALGVGPSLVDNLIRKQVRSAVTEETERAKKELQSGMSKEELERIKRAMQEKGKK